MKLDAYDSWKISLLRSSMPTLTPVEVMFELTSRCNFDCKMCYVHNQSNQDVLSRELSTEQWKRIMDEAFCSGMLFATLTGGECLLRRDFKELYLHLFNKGVHVSVMSNGLLINDDLIEFFKKYPPRSIQVSVYGSNNDDYENVTGFRAFDIIDQNLQQIRSLNKTKLRIAVTPSRYLIDDYKSILTYCKNNGFELARNEMFLFENRDNKDKNDYYLSVQELVQLEIIRHEMFRPLTPISDLPLPGAHCADPVHGTGCNAGTCSAFISWDGLMSPCVNLLICKESVISDSFQNAWERTTQCAKSFLQPIECNGCAYTKTCFHCPAIRLSQSGDGHCNPTACELTVNKCKAGIFKKL